MKDNLYKPQKTLINTKEVAELLGVNEKIVYSLISEKGLPGTKITGKWLFPAHLVIKWIEESIINRDESQSMDSDDAVLTIAGSNDPLLETVVACYNKKFERTGLAVLASVGSMGGITAMKNGFCHVACAHLLHGEDNSYNFAHLREQIGHPLPVAINFCRRIQGIMIAPGNPKKIDDISSVIKPDILFINRSPGTGTRLLLEHELQKAGIDKENINGYKNEVPSHLATGIEILTGRADMGIGIETVARQLGLGFIPLREERFDLLVHKNIFFAKAVQQFIALIHQNWFKKTAEKLGGYNTKTSGQVIYPE